MPALILLAVLLGGCSTVTSVSTPGSAPTPAIVVTTFVPTASPEASGSLSALSTPTGPPAPDGTSSPPADDPPTSMPRCPISGGATSYYCSSKSAEGGRGGPPLVDLPAALAMDYWVKGTCTFMLGLSSETSAAGFPSLTMTVSGPAVVGIWRLRIEPGHYYPVIGEAVGCVYNVNLRDDH